MPELGWPPGPWPEPPPHPSLSRTRSILAALDRIAHRVGLVFKKCGFSVVVEAEQKEPPASHPLPRHGSTSLPQLRPASQTLKVSPSGAARHSGASATVQHRRAAHAPTMGQGERGWVVGLAFLGFVASVESLARGELFPFGPSAGDQRLAAGGDQTLRLDLDSPVLFYDGSFHSIFVSSTVSCFSHAWVFLSCTMSADLAQLSGGGRGGGLSEQGSAVNVDILNNGGHIWTRAAGFLPLWSKCGHSVGVHAFLRPPPPDSNKRVLGSQFCNPPRPPPDAFHSQTGLNNGGEVNPAVGV